MDLHTPVTVPVERDGEYQVSIFAIRKGMGILGSGMSYTQQVMVQTSVIMSTTARQPSHISTTPGMKYSIPKCKSFVYLLGSALSTPGCEEARIITILGMSPEVILHAH